MKLIVPFVSSTAHCTSSSDPICWSARLRGDLLEGQPLPAQVAVDHLAVLHDHDRLAVEDRPQPREAEAELGDEHREQRERPDDEHERR